MVENLKNPNKSYLVNLSTFDSTKSAVGPVQDLLLWLRKAQDGTWINVNWETLRYGYAWGFHNTTIRLAAAALLLYVLLVISHMVVLLHRGWMPQGPWNSIGEILLLALESPDPVRRASQDIKPTDRAKRWRRTLPRYIPAYSRKTSAWTQKVRISTLGDGLVLSKAVADDRRRVQPKVHPSEEQGKTILEEGDGKIWLESDSGKESGSDIDQNHCPHYHPPTPGCL